MKRLIAMVIAALMLPLAALAAPGDMNVATFLTKADGLRAMGPAAFLSSDYGLLKAEGKAAGAQYKARLTRERAAGRPSSCPPEGAGFSADQLLAHLRTYPPAVRPQVSIRQAVADYFITKHPCRK